MQGEDAWAPATLLTSPKPPRGTSRNQISVVHVDFLHHSMRVFPGVNLPSFHQVSFARLAISDLDFRGALGARFAAFDAFSNNGAVMTRILFVDDQAEALASLRQMLRAYRREWTMEFCQGTDHAFELLAEASFDVVVTDTQMGAMDGADLLKVVRDLYPNAVRIVLTSPSEQERALRAVGFAHQVLAKPCDPESLYRAISRAGMLANRVSDDALKALVGRMDSLPSLPDIYYELVDELQREDASVDRVGSLISRDVSMTAKVLQLVNSSYFGLPVHVNDASHAAALLGLNTLKPLVLTASIFRQLEQSRVPKAFLESIISHSMATGGMAKQIAKAEGLSREAVDNTFIGGALHDIGKVILADNFGRDYAALCRQAHAEESPIAALELEQFGATHADVGGYLLSLWGLPADVIEAVALHHDPSASAGNSFSALTAVHVANAFASADDAAEDLLDLEFLARLRMEHRIEAWRQIAIESDASV